MVRGLPSKDANGTALGVGVDVDLALTGLTARAAAFVGAALAAGADFTEADFSGAALAAVGLTIVFALAVFPTAVFAAIVLAAGVFTLTILATLGRPVVRGAVAVFAVFFIALAIVPLTKNLLG